MVICVLVVGFKLKGGFLDLLLLLIFVAGIFDFLYIGLFFVCSFVVMNVDSFFNFSFLFFVVLWYNFIDFFYLVCKGCGRRLKICCKLVRSIIKFI